MRGAICGDLFKNRPRLVAQLPHSVEHPIARAFFAPQHIAHRRLLLLSHSLPPIPFDFFLSFFII